MKREELKSRLPPHLGRDVAQAVAAAMEREAALAGDELVVSLASHRPSLDDRFAARLKQVTALLDSGGMSPPLKEAVMEQVGLEEKEMSELLGHMVENGAAVRIASDLYMSAKAVAEAREKLKAFLTSHKVISTQELKDLFGLSRKYLIPLGEYFDASKLTVRVGATERKLRGGQ
jgi:selenocysteine-specific elongation factor